MPAWNLLRKACKTKKSPLYADFLLERGIMDNIKETREFKKCVFQCARRAMLENEYFLKDFLNSYVLNNYSIDDLSRFNTFLKNIYDNDLFDIIMGNKTAEDFKEQYEYKFLKDIEVFAKTFRYKAISNKK